MFCFLLLVELVLFHLFVFGERKGDLVGWFNQDDHKCPTAARLADALNVIQSTTENSENGEAIIFSETGSFLSLNVFYLHGISGQHAGLFTVLERALHSPNPSLLLALYQPFSKKPEEFPALE